MERSLFCGMTALAAAAAGPLSLTCLQLTHSGHQPRYEALERYDRMRGLSLLGNGRPSGFAQHELHTADGPTGVGHLLLVFAGRRHPFDGDLAERPELTKS